MSKTSKKAAPRQEQANREAIEQLQEAQQQYQLAQQTYQRETLAILRSTASTVRSMACRDSREQAITKAARKQAERMAHKRRRKAVRLMIVTWVAAAAMCIGTWIVWRGDLIAAGVVYFVNAAAVAAAMYISGYLHGWGWSGGGKL